MLHRIGILLVTYNQLEKTQIWIQNYLNLSLKTAGSHLLVLDNASTDSTYSVLKSEYPDLDIRLLNSNYGCTTGRNIGIAELYDLGCDLYFGFDPDVLINDVNFFHDAIAFLDNNPSIDGFTPILRYYEDMSIQGLGGRRGRMGVMKTISEVTDNHSIDYLPGGSSIIRMSAFEKYGIYDNDLSPIGGQDYEWGYRITKFGGILKYNPNMEVIHYHDKEAKNTDPVQKRWIFISRTVFLRKHFTLGHFFRELKHFFSSLIHFNPVFVTESYAHGFRKPLNANSSDFFTFLKTNRKTSYYNAQDSSGLEGTSHFDKAI